MPAIIVLCLALLNLTTDVAEPDTSGGFLEEERILIR
jgi:hypothetical protein